MPGLAALLVLALESGSAVHRAPDLRLEAPGGAADPAGPSARLVAVPDHRRDVAAAVPPPCAGDVCQPRVSVPGYEPRFSITGLRTRLTVSALDALRIEPVASVARWLEVTGVRLDYTPAALDAAQNPGTPGVSHFKVLMRVRLDAWGAPVWTQARR